MNIKICLLQEVPGRSWSRTHAGSPWNQGEYRDKGMAAERDSLLGVLLGTHPFNVTISANHRRLVEHGSKMMKGKKEPAIVKPMPLSRYRDKGIGRRRG